jgi:glutamate dehydrogenase (NAD(P)+)
VAEAASGPTTPGADRVLHDRGVFVIPDILCGAGGVTGSYFEWVQDTQGFFWEELEVVKQLEKVITKAFREVHEAAKRQKLDMRTAAYLLAVARVAGATRTRGLFP